MRGVPWREAALPEARGGPPRDLVAMTGAGLRVNGQALPESRIEPSLGDELFERGMHPPRLGSPVPAGFGWLLGEHDDH